MKSTKDLGAWMTKQHEIGQIYAQYLEAENEKNRQERYVGKEHYYHASGAGKCSRQLYFATVDKVEPTNPSNSTGNRVMRLGTVVHNDIQNSLIYSNTLSNNINNNINNNITNKNITNKLESKEFIIEGEIVIEELSVRGFFDVVLKNSLSGITLYDIKTAASYSFTKVFNPKESYTMKHHELQLGTYGYAIKEKYGRLDGMYLLYYNKNTSVMKYQQIPLMMVNAAYMFWVNINKQHASGLPGFEDGVSPVMNWECNYCNYFDHCKPPTGYGKYNHQHTIKGKRTNE